MNVETGWGHALAITAFVIVCIAVTCFAIGILAKAAGQMWRDFVEWNELRCSDDPADRLKARVDTEIAVMLLGAVVFILLWRSQDAVAAGLATKIAFCATVFFIACIRIALLDARAEALGALAEPVVLPAVRHDARSDHKTPLPFPDPRQLVLFDMD
jgi:hypothetical protein